MLSAMKRPRRAPTPRLTLLLSAATLVGCGESSAPNPPTGLAPAVVDGGAVVA